MASQPHQFASRISRIVFVIMLWLSLPSLAAAQNGPPEPETQKCTGLTKFSLEDTPGSPALILSAHMVDVPANGLEQWPKTTSGYGKTGGQIETGIRKYCEVTGYVAPQNKFILKLPLPDDWNQKFFFRVCGGFCGYLDGRLCSASLARGYASVTGNGGHDSALGFDGIWAANAPELQEDFGWRSNHAHR